MREKMERFVLLPFAIGCISDSSIAVGIQQQPRRSKSDTNPSPIRPKEVEEEEEEDRLSSGEKMKNTLRSHALPKPHISIGIHRLFKGFKTISQIFVYKDEIEEELELDMEIGNPTDVKHVTHIGLDGSASAASYATTDQQPIKSTSNWDNLDLISPVSWRQFEFSMPSPANAEEASLANVNI